eukprot:5311013-Prorocentrum_lima.AAC.1
MGKQERRAHTGKDNTQPPSNTGGGWPNGCIRNIVWDAKYLQEGVRHLNGPLKNRSFAPSSPL